MIQDQQLKMSDGQTGITATGASTSTIDATKKGDALDGSQLYWVARVATTLTSGGSTAVVQATLETADDAAFSVNKTLLIAGAATLVTSLTAGAIMAKAIVPTGARQFLRTNYVVTVESLTGGAFDSFLTPDVDILLPNF